MSDAADRAEVFLQSNARVLERRLFECMFRDGPGEPVRQALLAYRNADGGFGSGLEPDVRASCSTALHCEIALYALRDAGIVDPELGEEIAGFLASAAEPDGRVPVIDAAALESPHAQHWDFGLFPAPSPNPTASLAGMLGAQGVSHEWVQRATTWTWACINEPGFSGHEMIAAATFLADTPDRARVAGCADAVMAGVREAKGVQQRADAKGYGVTPLQIFRGPEAPGVSHLDAATASEFLDALAAAQHDDGGWPIAFEPVSPACEAEWRGRFTLEALTLLRAWDRL